MKQIEHFIDGQKTHHVELSVARFFEKGNRILEERMDALGRWKPSGRQWRRGSCKILKYKDEA